MTEEFEDIKNQERRTNNKLLDHISKGKTCETCYKDIDVQFYLMQGIVED